MYNDPENPVHARSEAQELVLQADSNGDNQLSLEEVLSKKDIFLGSKMVNTARNIHDEFWNWVASFLSPAVAADDTDLRTIARDTICDTFVRSKCQIPSIG